MIKEQYEVLYREAIKTYGVNSQIMMLFEEVSELQKEICKNARGKDNTDSILEEVVDVMIMLDQIQLIYQLDQEKLSKMYELKMNRLEARIELEKHNKGKFMPLVHLAQACKRVGDTFRKANETDEHTEYVYQKESEEESHVN